MDAQKAAMMTETILKEKKIQRQYYKSQQEAGKLTVQEPPVETIRPSAMDTVTIPSHVMTTKMNPELNMGMSLSQSMWAASNPGYILRDGNAIKSTSKADYVWDQEEIDFMKAQGQLDKTFNRKRDDFSQYVEASSKMNMLIKGNNHGPK